MTERCLVLIDWQKAFRDISYWGERNNPDAEHNAARLLAHWREIGQPVVHVKHDSTEPASPLRPDQPGNEFEDFAVPIGDEPLHVKNVNSAFIGTSLERHLRDAGIQDLVFSGVTTDHCVNTSVRMAANLGFSVTLVADACYTFGRTTPGGLELTAEVVHETHLASLMGEFAQVENTDEIIAA